MSESFFARLERRAQESDSLLCVGLDPHPEMLEQPTAAAARGFCLRLIELCAGYACAFKPNSAFFEAFGTEGIEALAEVIAAVPDSIPVVLDAKRGDIASTAQAYARAVFDTLGADAVTASPYLGRDSLDPFLTRPERGVFVLCKTSNPGADEFQALPVCAGEPLYVRVARQAQAWRAHHGHDNLGLVVGATDPAALARVRSAAPDLWFLAPGVGAQGGDLAGSLAAGLRADGLGMLVAVSRSIARASDPGAAAAALRGAINDARRQTGPRKVRRSEGLEVASAVFGAGCVRFGQFTLKSGEQAPIYLDLRRLASDPRALSVVGDAFLPVLRGLEFELLAAIPYGGLPIGTAVALAGGWPLIYPRQEVKAHGTRSAVEGAYQSGETAVVIDDVVTTGGSKFEAIQKLEAAGLKVRDVVVLVDREQGATETMSKAGYRLHSVATLRSLLADWRASRAVTEEQYQEVMAYLG